FSPPFTSSSNTSSPSSVNFYNLRRLVVVPAGSYGGPMRKVVIAVLKSLLTCVVSFAAYGQEPEIKITGSVKDPDGAVVSGADVSLLTANRAVIGATVSDGDGKFTLNNIAPGDYQLSVQANGFVRHRSAVRVTQGNPVTVAVVLELTPVNEQVTITAEAGLVTDT